MSYLISWPAAAPADPDPHTPVLLCLPQAGAGAGRFRAWQERLSSRATVLGVQLPGREERWSDPPPRDLDEVVESVVAELFRTVDRGRPVVVFGDSFGGLIGYEIARALRPRALIACVCRAPEHWGRTGGITEADVQNLIGMALTDQELPQELADEIRQLAAESLSRDVALSRTYQHRPGPELDCPVYAWGAVGDDTVSSQHLDDWRASTTATCHRHDFQGGHRVSVEETDAVLSETARVLDAVAGRPSEPFRAPA